MVRAAALVYVDRRSPRSVSQSTIPASQIEESQLQFGYGDVPGAPPDPGCAFFILAFPGVHR